MAHRRLTLPLIKGGIESTATLAPWIAGDFSSCFRRALSETPDVRTPGQPRLPWTPSKDLDKRKHYFKRMDHLRQMLEDERSKEILAEKKFPEFGPGDVLHLKLLVPENKRKEEKFSGVCIAMKNKSLRTTFTLRKTFPGGVGVERIFPLHSPNILEIKVVGKKRIRRAKLYHLEKKAKETQV
ncbi:hypothetical protein BSKO_06527 [Bryopsis sp. KO-2023]|nr:hypothetical protein BSKO_06527 [Bryopsis sp. KO-2023]